jgi:hypothetical protein
MSVSTFKMKIQTGNRSLINPFQLSAYQKASISQQSSVYCWSRKQTRKQRRISGFCRSIIFFFGIYVHNVLSSTTYKYAPNLESLLTQQYACVNVHSDLIKHRCQKRSDWMFRINHPIAVNITNKCGLGKN